MPTGDVIPACPSQKFKREEPREGRRGGVREKGGDVEWQLRFRSEKKRVSELS